MIRSIGCLTLLLGLSRVAAGAELATAPSADLLKIYAHLQALQGSEQGAVAENVVWQRDAAKFTFQNGKLTFAQPVAGRVLAAVFRGEGTFELDPPTPIARRQIARYAKNDKLEDSFREAVFFFTDDSWEELQKLVKVGGRGEAAEATKALESAQKKFSQEYNDWWANRVKGNPIMRNLAARMLADLTDPSSRGFFLANFKGKESGNLLYHISWNRDLLLMPEVSNDEEVILLRVGKNEFTEWWGGFHLRDEYKQTPHPDHRTLLAHCRIENIDAEIGNDNRLSASAEMEFEVSKASARVLPLMLEGVLRIGAVTDGTGNKLAFIQEARDHDNDPWVILPAPAAPGQVYKIKIAYDEDSTHDSRVIFQRGSGLYYVTARESWFPSFGAFDDRTMYHLKFRSPKKFTFVATGRALRSEKTKEGAESEWESEIPYSVVGFNYGDFADRSAGDKELTVTAYGGKEIPDELKGLQNALDLADMYDNSPRAERGAEGTASSQLGITAGGWDTTRMVKVAAETSFKALRLDQFYFGPLPFKTVSVTEQPVGFYGQSWPTLIYLPYSSLLDPEKRHEFRMDTTPEAREFYNIVAVHEMAHQWWGHLVGWKTYHDEWLSEGFAEFSAALYLEKTEPKKVKEFWDLKRKWLFSKDRASNRPIDVGPLWQAAQLPSYMEPGLYQVLVYFKGAYVLGMLRELMKDVRQKNPDTPFIEMMRDFSSTYAGKNASTEDFRRMVEKHAGQPMDWFFNEWVYGTEVPHYDFSYELKPEDNGKTLLELSLTQLEVSDSFFMRVPVEASVNGRTFRLGLIGARGPKTTTAKVPLPFKPDKIMLDDQHVILSTARQ